MAEGRSVAQLMKLRLDTDKLFMCRVILLLLYVYDMDVRESANDGMSTRNPVLPEGSNLLSFQERLHNQTPLSRTFLQLVYIHSSEDGLRSSRSPHYHRNPHSHRRRRRCLSPTGAEKGSCQRVTIGEVPPRCLL